MHVLIVDDELSIRETFQAFLEDEGYDATTAADFFEAESFLADHAYDVVVADIVLPRIDGLTLLQRVREVDTDVPVIMVTGEPDVSTAAEAVRHGAYDYVAKPVTQEMLLRVVGRAVEKKRLLDAKRRLEAENRAYQADLERKVAERTAELEQRNQELRALIEIGQGISATLDLTEVLKRVTQRATQVCGALRCTILLLTEDGKALIPIMSQFSNGHVDRKMWRSFKSTVQPWQVAEVPKEIGQIISERRPLFIPDASASSLPRHWIEPFEVKSVLVVPLISKDQFIGLMALDHVEEGRGFTAEQVDLAMAVATQAAIATENAQLFQSERKRASQLAVVNQVARKIASILDLEQLLQEIVVSIQEGFNYFNLALFLMDETASQLEMLALHGGFEPVARLDYSQAVGEGLIGLAARSGQSVLVNDVERDPRFISGFLSTELPQSELCVPIKLIDQVIGVLDVQDTKLNAFDETDLVAMQTLADQIAIAIENARHFEEAQRRAVQLEVASEVARDAAAILDVDQLLDETVRLISSKFGFYHAAVFLVDERSEYAVLQAASSEGGQRILEQGYKLAVGKAGVIGHVAGAGKHRLAVDVSKDAMYLASPDLPDTRSEMALPLVSRGRVIGVLDVQSVHEAAFTEEDMASLQTMADQLANAIENARLFEAEQRRRQEAETLYRAAQALTTTLDLSQVFECILSELQQVVPYDSASVQLLQDGRLEIIGGHGFPNLDELLGITFDLSKEDNPNREVIRRRASFIVEDAPLVYPAFHEEPHASTGIRAWLGVPLLIGDRPVGMLALDKRERGFYTSEHARLASAFAAQAAIAIENARLYEEQRKRALQAESLLHIEQAINSSLELDPTLHTIVEMMAQLMGVTQSGIILFDEEYKCGCLTAEYQEVENASVGELEIPLEGNLSIERILATREPLAIYDAENDSLLESIRDVVRQRRMKSILIVPLITKGRVIGTIGFDAIEAPRRFTEEEIRLGQILAGRAAIAIENAQLYNAAQREIAERKRAEEALRERAVRLELIARVGQRTTAILERDELLHQAVDLIGDAFGYYIVNVMLVEDGEIVLRAATLPSLQSLEGLLRLRVGSDGITGWVAGNGEPLLVPDVSLESRYRLILEEVKTTSELAVPIRLKGITIGVLDVQSIERDAFSQADVFTLQTIADQLAVAIENAQLYEEARRHVDELTALHNIDVAITSILDPDEVLQVIYEQINGVMSLTTFFIGLYGEEKDELYLPLVMEKGERLPPILLEEEGLSGWVVHNRQPLMVEDMDEEQGALPVKFIPFGIPPRSLMLLPLIAKDRVIGVISVQSDEPHAFDEGHQRLFSNIARQVAIAVENAQLFEETNRRLAETRLLQEVMQAAASTLDFDEVIARTIETLHGTLSMDYLAFVIPDERGGMIMHSARIGYPLDPEELRVTLDGSVCGRAYQSGEPQLISDVREVPYYFGAASEIRSELAVPVKVAGRIVAVLNAESPQLGAFGEEDLRLFSAVAAQLGVVLENARLFEETKRRLTETRLLQEVMQAAASTLDFDEVLTRTVEILHRTLGIGYLAFILPDEREDSLKVHPSRIGYPSVDAETRVPLASSVSGRVYQTGEPQIIPDVRQVSYYFETTPGLLSELAVPVTVADRVIAVLDAGSLHLGTFDENALRLFSAIAAQLGVVLENTRLFEETSRRLTETRLLQEVMQAAAATLDFDEVVTRIIETLHRTLDIEHLTFVVPDEQGNLVMHPSRVGYLSLPENSIIPLDQSVCGRVYQSGEPQVISDVREVSYYAEGLPETLSELAVPVKVASRVIAVLNAESPQLGAFGEDELRIFSAVAAQMGVVLENARLYQRLESQALELSRAYEELREIDRLRTELVQNVSHELRTPLSLIRGYVELLLDGDLGNVLDAQRDALQIIRERAAALSRLIHNLTMLQDTPQEVLSLAPVPIVEVIQHALEEFRRPAQKAGISFYQDIPAGLPLLLGDRRRLELVFEHLIANAIKFSPGGGAVSIRAWAERDMVCVLVTDKGIGIASEHLERIFERFYQVDGSARRRFGGMGVGLALVWEIVRDHGGAVTVESELGEGSTFTVALPVVSSH
jgi:GAF domain-containing protein/FixJ family two-component response regulator/anti-sigma regulatory factor (Ser/Thr protein kinase)